MYIGGIPFKKPPMSNLSDLKMYKNESSIDQTEKDKYIHDILTIFKTHANRNNTLHRKQTLTFKN